MHCHTGSIQLIRVVSIFSSSISSLHSKQLIKFIKVSFCVLSCSHLVSSFDIKSYQWHNALIDQIDSVEVSAPIVNQWNEKLSVGSVVVSFSAFEANQFIAKMLISFSHQFI